MGYYLGKIFAALLRRRVGRDRWRRWPVETPVGRYCTV